MTEHARFEPKTADTDIAPSWRLPTRVLLLAITLLGLVLLGGGLPVRWIQLQTVCLPSTTCPALLLLPIELELLQQRGITPAAYAGYQIGLEFLLIVPVAVLWFIVYWRYSHTIIGALTCLALLFLGVSLGNIAWAWTQVSPYAARLSGLVSEVGGAALILLLFLFPDGTFTPRWTRYFAYFLVAVVLPYGLVVTVLWPEAGGSWLRSLNSWLWVVFLVVGVAAQIVRYRTFSTRPERQQSKLVVAGFVALVLSVLLWFITMEVAPFSPGAPRLGWNLLGTPLLMALSALLPVTLAVAILRYGLWEIDVIVNRALVYGGLTAWVVALYALVVGGTGRIFQTQDNFASALMATGLAAVLFNPLHQRLQQGVNRVVYGERGDALQILTHLGEVLVSAESPTAILPAYAQTIHDKLLLPYVAIWLRTGADQLAVAGQVGTRPPGHVTLPLVYHGQSVGQLEVAPRAGQVRLSRTDLKLLNQVAAQTAIAVNAVRLAQDVQQARQRLVVTREEERRRLRRDLHDGLGPVLAGQALKLAAARQLVRTQPAVAERLLDEVMRQSEHTVGDVRRLVYGLRPPMLDELGLEQAIQEHVQDLAVTGGTRIRVICPADLPEIPAAVEVAAFRIVQEALNNVVRHAQATQAIVAIAVDDALDIIVEDNGIGLPEARRTGVGSLSMRERAAEVGGTCQIDASSAGGVRIHVVLPLFASHANDSPALPST